MTARLATTRVCDVGYCETGNLLVRGDQISFVSVEQVRKVGRHKLDPLAMPSDVVLPKTFVVVHDPTAQLLNKCDMHFVRWRNGMRSRAHTVSPELMRIARAYFGNGKRITRGVVDIPKGPWHRECEVQFIRYRREGDDDRDYEHEYDVPVVLQYSARSFAWRLPLPEGCIVNAHGFVKP